jgi:hypothetical protein|tara:strand:- start:24872 stop:26806 length:1935 start_codon:yes stop_codon:yes gene_type:complete
MPFTEFNNLDFDQIKSSIKDYLRANSKFTDFDFEGSNFSILIDTLAYNTYINAFNSNMIANESFLDSATLRQNVVGLARNIGYVPKSRKSARAVISFEVFLNGVDSQTLTLKSGLVCTGNTNNTSYVFSIPEDITVQTIDFGTTKLATFDAISVYEGISLRKSYTVDTSIEQKFELQNSYIDTDSIRVYVKGQNETGRGKEYNVVDNITDIDSTSEIFLIQEIKDETYEVIFGDGVFGKKLENGSVITIEYIVTNGEEGNGVRNLAFAGSLQYADQDGNLRLAQSDEPIVVNTILSSREGSSIESVDSIKYYAPRAYSAQNRAVTARDYEYIVRKVYPNAEAVSVIGGEELDPPEFGSVTIAVKPKNGTFLSDFTKEQILVDLKNYSITGINQKIVDLKILYVEIESSVYYNSSQISTPSSLKSSVIGTLERYAKSADLNKFGGRFKYSKVQQVIDNTNSAITSNITKVRMRRDMKVSLNNFAQYELCFGNRFYINEYGFNVKSTGFTVEGESSIVYLTDTPNKDLNGNLDGSGKGVLSVVKETVSGTPEIVIESVGVVDYIEGEILLNTVKINSTVLPDGIIEVQAFPDSNDVIGLKDLYLIFDVGASSPTINMRRDTISSGESISGTRYITTSSYPNGKLTR